MDTRELTPPLRTEPVAAQVRFRRPERGLADWSVWQQTTIKPNMPAWSIDSAGYEVEYRLLYTSPQPSAVPDFIQSDDAFFDAVYAANKETLRHRRQELISCLTPSAPATVQGDAIKAQLLEALEAIVNVGGSFRFTHDLHVKARAAIAAAR